jgi:hypothetical protein
MSLNADLREFIELLNSRGIEYVIVGGHSLAFHARPQISSKARSRLPSKSECGSDDITARAPYYWLITRNSTMI